MHIHSIVVVVESHNGSARLLDSGKTLPLFGTGDCRGPRAEALPESGNLPSFTFTFTLTLSLSLRAVEAILLPAVSVITPHQ